MVSEIESTTLRLRSLANPLNSQTLAHLIVVHVNINVTNNNYLWVSYYNHKYFYFYSYFCSLLFTKLIGLALYIFGDRNYLFVMINWNLELYIFGVSLESLVVWFCLSLVIILRAYLIASVVILHAFSHYIHRYMPVLNYCWIFNDIQLNFHSWTLNFNCSFNQTKINNQY